MISIRIYDKVKNNSITVQSVMQDRYLIMGKSKMNANEKLKHTIPKGTFIRCFGDINNKKIVADSYSHSSFSSKNKQSLLLIEGDLIYYKLDNSFILHGGTTKELIDFQVVSMAKKSVCITILLSGKLDFGYEDLNFSLDAGQRESAVIVNLSRPVSFRRTLHKNNSVSKLNIILPTNWLENRLQKSDNLNAFIAEHLAHFKLNLNNIMLKLALDIMKLSSPSHFIEKMQVEVLTQQLLLEVFKQLNDSAFYSKKQSSDTPIVDENLFAPTLDKLITYIETNLEQNISVTHLADFAAMSLSSLQRKFKHSLGTTLQGYILRRRLDIAKQQLEVGLISISEAAYNAGYRHPSNFTSAFKKTFGFPPQNVVVKGTN